MGLLRKIAMVLLVLIWANVTLFAHAEQNSLQDMIVLKFEVGSNLYTSNSLQNKMKLSPVVINRKIYMPYSDILQEFGYKTYWDYENNKIMAKRDDSIIEITMNEKKISVNGVETAFRAIQNAYAGIAIPLDFIIESNGAYVNWDKNDDTILILKINKLNDTFRFSANGDKVLFCVENDNWFTCDIEGKNIASIGKWDALRWLDKDRLFAQIYKTDRNAHSETESGKDSKADGKTGSKTDKNDNKSGGGNSDLEKLREEVTGTINKYNEAILEKSKVLGENSVGNSAGNDGKEGDVPENVNISSVYDSVYEIESNIPSDYFIIDSSGNDSAGIEPSLNTKRVGQKWVYRGKTLNGKYYYTIDGELYCENDGKLYWNTEFDCKIKYISAVSEKGPYFIVPQNVDELRFYETPFSEPLILGRASLLVNANGDVGVSAFDTSIIYDEHGEKAAFYQKNGDGISLWVVDIQNPTKLKSALLPFEISSARVKNKLNTKWDADNQLSIESPVYKWSISVETMLKVVETNTGITSVRLTPTLLYTKDSKGNISFLITSGKTTRIMSVPNKEVQNWYSFKDKVLATFFDKITKRMSLVLFSGNSYKVLKDNFNIEQTFEYNDNLLIAGYDRSLRLNVLYRFDGSKLSLIARNFGVGKFSEFKGKLVLNQYDKYRHYTLMYIDKNSDTPWQPVTIKDGFIVDDFIMGNLRLYMLGQREAGTETPIVYYDGVKNDLTVVVNNNKTYLAKDLFEYSGQLLEIKENMGIRVVGKEPLACVTFNATAEELSDISSEVTAFGEAIAEQIEAIGETETAEEFETLTNLINKRNALANIYRELSVINKHEVFKEKLYISTKKIFTIHYRKVTGGVWEWACETIAQRELGLVSFNKVLSGYDVLVPNFTVNEFNVKFDYLFATGEVKYKDSTIEKMLYVLDGGALKLPVRDVIKINDDTDEEKRIFKVGDKVFLSIQDQSRFDKLPREAIIYIKDGVVYNVALNHSSRLFADINNRCVIDLTQIDTNVSSISSYDGNAFKELYENYQSVYWKRIDDALFITLKSDETGKLVLMKFEGKNVANVGTDILVEDILKIQSGYYMIYGSKSGKKTLWLYRSRTNDMTELRTNVNILKMISYGAS